MNAPLPTPLPIIRAHVNALAHGNAITVQPGSAEAAAYSWAVEQLSGFASQTVSSDSALREANERIRRLTEELNWYGDPGNYLIVPAKTQIAADKGARARRALGLNDPTVGA